MKFKKNLLLGISALTLAGFAMLGANAGSGKACGEQASADKAAACASKTSSVQTVSNEAGSCASKGVQTASAGSCAAKASHAVQTVSNEAGSCGSHGVQTASAGSCAAKASHAVQTVSNEAGSCASKGVQTASAGSCAAKASQVQMVSNGSCCASKGVQTADAGACGAKATAAVQTVSNVGSCASAHGASAGACGSKMMNTTASNASCSSANPSECMDAWLPEGMSFIRLDVPGGVDFVFSGKGVEKLTQACAGKSSAVAAEHGSRFAMTQGDGYVVLSVRGDDAASCCGEVVETAFAGAGIRS